MRGKLAGVDQHADADEEQPEQHVAEWTNAGLHLMAEFGLPEHHARQERTERQRQTQVAGRPGGSQHDQQDREGEQLCGPALGDQVEHRTHGPAHGVEDQPKGQDGLGQGPANLSSEHLHARGRAQHRDEDQEGDGGDILKDRNGQAEPAVWGGLLALFGQLPTDDGRR
jgi:hypothetical protein